MKKLEVFEPAGTDADPALTQFAADLKWVEERGIAVQRHNLGQNPQAFAANAAVAKEMEMEMETKTGTARLPILAIDGHLLATGAYPTRQQLAQMLGIPMITLAISQGADGPVCTPESGCG